MQLEVALNTGYGEAKSALTKVDMKMSKALVPEIRYEQLPESVVPNRALGRHIVHDARSKGFRALDVLTLEKPARIRAWQRITMWDQNAGGSWNNFDAESSCTVQACGGVLMTVPFLSGLNRTQKGKLNEPGFRYSIYRRAQELDPWPGGEPDYYGSSGLAACKALVEAGVVPEGWKYRWAFGIDEAMQVLRAAPLSVGTNWYSGFDNPDRFGRVKKEGYTRGGHQWEVIDYDEADDMIIGLNSWGRTWGRNGRFAMPRADFASLLEEDGDVVVWTKG